MPRASRSYGARPSRARRVAGRPALTVEQWVATPAALTVVLSLCLYLCRSLSLAVCMSLSRALCVHASQFRSSLHSRDHVGEIGPDVILT